jgi:hypothetical protein
VSRSHADRLGTGEQMNHLDRGHLGKVGDRSRLLRLSVVGGLAALTLAVSLPGVALAGNAAKTTPYAGASGVSAAQDQYGKRIITGYFAGVPQIMGMNPSVYPPRECGGEGPNANGSPWVGSSDLTSTTPYTETLTFQGVTIPAPYAYIWGTGA